MKNRITIFAAVIVVAVFGLGAYTLFRNSPQTNSSSKDEVMMPKEETEVEPTAAMMQKDDRATEADKMKGDKMANSRYVEFSKPVFDSAQNGRRVLFFYASWCPTCRPADANFTKNSGEIPEDVTLIRVNYNDPETDQEEKDLARKYGITYQHTFVQIDRTGKEVAKWNGGQIEGLLSNIK